MNSLIVPLQETALYLLAAYGLYFMVKILRFPDISTDNVFSLGGIAGVFAISLGSSALLTALLVTLVGAVVGIFTSCLHSIAKIPKLMAGVLTYSMLFSVNLKFFGRPNVPLAGPESWELLPIIIVDLAAFILFFYISISQLGKSLVATGVNPRLITEFEGPKRSLIAVGVGLGNGLVALSGYLTSNYFGFADVGLGTGVLIHAIAVIMIGEEVLRYWKRVHWLVALAAASVLYNMITYNLITHLAGGILSFSDYKIVAGFVVITLFLVGGRGRSGGDPLLG